MSKEIERLKFAEFLCMTSELRMQHFGYDTQTEFGKQYGITDKSLSCWKSEPKFKKMKMQMQLALVDDKLPDVLRATYDRAIQGDVAAQTQYYKILGLSKDKLEIISADDIKGIVSGIIEVLTEEIKDKAHLNRIAKRIEEIVEDY